MDSQRVQASHADKTIYYHVKRLKRCLYSAKSNRRRAYLGVGGGIQRFFQLKEGGLYVGGHIAPADFDRHLRRVAV